MSASPSLQPSRTRAQSASSSSAPASPPAAAAAPPTARPTRTNMGRRPARTNPSFAPSSSLRPALPLSIDVSLAQIALPPSSLLHKPPMVLPIEIHSDDDGTDALEHGPAAAAAAAQTWSESRRADLQTSASSPCLLDLHSWSLRQQYFPSSAYSTGSASETPRPDTASAVAPSQTTQHHQRSASPAPLDAQPEQQQHLQPQQEVLALLSASTLDSAGIISSSPSSSSPAMSRSSSQSGVLLSGSSTSDEVASVHAVAVAAPHQSSAYMRRTSTGPRADRPLYYRSPSVTSFASDGSWHGDAGDWDPESQLKSAAEKVYAATSRTSRKHTSCSSQVPAASSSNAIFRTIGTGFGLVSSRVAARHQGQQDDDSDDDPLSDDQDDEEDDDEYSAGSNSLFSSAAPSRGGSFSMSQSECSGPADTSSVTSCGSRTFTSATTCSAAQLQYLRFKSIGHGLTPLKPSACGNRTSAASSPTKCTAIDNGPGQLASHGDPRPMPASAPEPVLAKQEKPTRSRSAARDTLREHAGPFIWLLTSLLDPLSRSSGSRESSTGPGSGSTSLANSVECSPDLSMLADEGELEGPVPQSAWTHSRSRRSREEYLFGPRSAWAHLRPDVERLEQHVAAAAAAASDADEAADASSKDSDAANQRGAVIDIEVDGDVDLNAALDWSVPSGSISNAEVSEIMDSIQQQQQQQQPSSLHAQTPGSARPALFLSTSALSAPQAVDPSSTTLLPAFALSPLQLAVVSERGLGFGFGFERDASAFATAAAFLLPGSAAPTPPPPSASAGAGAASATFGLGLAGPELSAPRFASVTS